MTKTSRNKSTENSKFFHGEGGASTLDIGDCYADPNMLEKNKLAATVPEI